MTMANTNKVCTCLKSNLLVILTLSGVVVGVTIGILVRETDPTQDVVIWIGIPGDVYMGSLKMVVLPLIITSVIAGTASLDPKCNGKISVVSFIYIVVTNSLACVVPVLIAVAAKPGKPDEVSEEMVAKEVGVSMETIDVFADLIRNLFPPNIIAACFQQFQTKYDYVTVENTDTLSDVNNTALNNQTDHVTKVKVLGKVPSTNILGLVICSFILGVATSAIGDEGRPFLAFFKSANIVIMKVLSWLIWMTPVGVASLIAKALLNAEQLDSIVKSLGLFSAITIGSLIAHGIVLAIVVHLVILRQNPLPFNVSMGKAYLVAFATTSTAMAMPELFHAMEDKAKLDSRVTRFTIPFATTINRDGSAIFIAVSCVFLAQMSGHTMNAAQIVILWTLLTFICMAIPAVPSASIVVVTIILSSLGISTHLVGLLFATEWILDRVRSCVNLTSHGYCALVVSHFCRNSLPPLKGIPDEENASIMEKPTATPPPVNEHSTHF